MEATISACAFAFTVSYTISKYCTKFFIIEYRKKTGLSNEIFLKIVSHFSDFLKIVFKHIFFLTNIISGKIVAKLPDLTVERSEQILKKQERKTNVSNID